MWAVLQVVSDLNRDGLRSGASTHAQGLPRLATMLDLAVTGGYGLYALPPSIVASDEQRRQDLPAEHTIV